jgi:dTDP-4-dehydrorhamnose 3,5-epimerase-like enzyme/dTDP-4-dehydrorhamnose reductase
MESHNSYTDERGKIIFLIKNNDFTSVETTVSINKKNVFRGLHINNFSKMVSCIQGSILDIIVNMTPGTTDYLKPQYFNLSALSKNNKIVVPPNYAHGFLTLEENTIIIYHFTDKFIPEETIHIHYQDPYINLQLSNLSENLIISEKDNLKNFIKPIDYVIIGSTGYLGKHITDILKNQGKNVISLSERLNNICEIKNKLTLYKPKYVINAAGISNQDWCDDNKEQTIEINVTYQLTLCHICRELGIYLTLFGTGGIFNKNIIYKDNDDGDYYEKIYSESRIYLEKLIISYKNVLYLRINYPISSCSNPKNLLVKIIKFTKISNSNISMTCVDTLFPLLSDIIENKEHGIMNFVNPGTINLVDIKEKYNNIHNISKNYESVNINYRHPVVLDTLKIEKYNTENINISIEKILQTFYN